jgi:hypothetical protein
MPKYVCSLDNKNAWNLPPGEASKQTFITQEEAKKWFEKKYPGQKITFSNYTTYQDHDENDVFANGEWVGMVAEYLD